MDNPEENPSSPKKDIPSPISCDSCCRAGALCIGGPECERCFLHGFECIFSPGQANIVELKNVFSSLLLPGQERPRTPSPIMETMVSIDEQRNQVEMVKRFGRSRREGGPCVVCRQLGRRCGKEKPKCGGCTSEGFECVYEAEERDSGAGVEVDPEDFKHRHVSGKISTGPRCDTCKVWKAYCDAKRPTCSSCLVRGVECRYTLPHEGTPGDPALSRPPPNRSGNPLNAPTKTWQTPALPPSVSAYYGAPSYPQRIVSPVSYPLGQMYSTPSGCIACFESKEKCFPSLQHHPGGKNICVRCGANGMECKAFPTGTKLVACDACTKSYKLCTNSKKGLQCDNCEEQGVECSRTSPAQSALLVKPSLAEVSSTTSPKPTPQDRPRTCDTCRALRRSCDQKTPRCSVCEEVDLACRYPALTIPDLNSPLTQPKRADTSCTSCEELELVCDGNLPTCYYCKELGRTCQRVGDPPIAPVESKPKPRPSARSACYTCRERKQRCDEGRPGCGTCERAGVVCGGYRHKAKADETRDIKAEEKIERKVDKKIEAKVKEKADENLQEKSEKKVDEKLKSQVDESKKGDEKPVPEKGESEDDKDGKDDWEEITHTEALPEGKPGEFGVVELD